jgi:hypothetical protein
MSLALSVVLWIAATSGGTHLFVKEVLGDAFDSQAEHFLRGDAGIDPQAISSEAMIVNGKIRTYFGPFPAFVRMPLNLIYRHGRGLWSRFSGFCAGLVALWSFAGLVGDSLRLSALSSPARHWIGNASLVGFVLATPLLFLIASLSIFNEADIWALAWSVSAIFFAVRARQSDGRRLTLALFGFGFSAAAALLSRVTFGLPLFLAAPIVAFRVRRAGWPRLVALAVPLLAGLAFHLTLSYARFGNFAGISYESYINGVHVEFVRRHGMFDLARLPYSFAEYFSLRPPAFRAHAPFVQVDRHFLPYPTLFSLPNTESYVSLTWSAGWLVLGAVFGIVYLFSAKHSDWSDRAVAAALLIQFILILCHFTLAQRYMTELLPFLTFCFAVFVRNGGFFAARAAIVTLVVISAAVNTLGTAFWLSNDGNLPIETRTFWSTVAGKPPPAQ